MPLIERYDTPAGIEDFAHDPQARAEFRAAWEEEVRLIVVGQPNIDQSPLVPPPGQDPPP